MKMPRALDLGWQSFALLLILTLVHRLVTFAALAGTVRLFSRDGFDAWLVGTLSDVWISYLGALLTVLVATLGRVLHRASVGRWWQALLLGGLTLAAALHVSYVDFFHIQMIPFHLRYLADPEFIRANSGSLVAWNVLGSLLVLPLSWWLVGRLGRGQAWSNAQLRWTFAGLTVAAVICHNRNINLREQWFIPDNLQVNALERLYLHLHASRVPPPFAPAQMAEAASAVAAPPPPPSAPLAAQLFGLITKPAGAVLAASARQPLEAAPPLLTALQQVFAAELKAKAKPLILVVLLESMRPAETGYFAPEAGVSLTPTLDALAAGGVVFTRAYSTGSVTRGAQEATWCGYLGSRSTSLMRGEAAARMSCLPDLITAADADRPGAPSASFLWLHGGDARFDGQVAFWRTHHVSEFLSLQDFPKDAPRTGWGVGDKAFFAAASARLVALHQSTQAAYILGLALSVTNHIPWDLPADAGPESRQPRTAGHPSYATTAYADAALGSFVAGLKEAGLWQHALVVVASDHGTLLPPLVDLYRGQQHPDLLLASHINLMLTGGITTKALGTLQLTHERIDHLVSQADVAPLIADVLQVPGRFMAENPLLPSRQLPVVSDLEQQLFDQGSGKAFTAGELTKANVPGALAPEERKALLYYQAFLQYIYLPR